MQKLEYKIICPINGPFFSEFDLNYEGKEGWELVLIDRGCAFFKRPLQTSEDTTSSNP